MKTNPAPDYSRLRPVPRDVRPDDWGLNPLLLFFLFFAVVVILHAPLLRLPYFWDEAGYYIPAAHDILLHFDFIPRDTLSNAHPPLVLAYLALVWKLTTYAPAVTRLAMLLVSAFGLLGVYRLAKKVSPTSVALATTLLVAVYPVWFAQSSLAHVDLASDCFTIWAISYFVEEKRRPAVLMFCLAALAKETGIITPCALFAYEFFWWALRHRRKAIPAWAPVQRPLRDNLALLLPLVPLALWFAYHYARTGYVFGNPEFFRYNVQAPLQLTRILLAGLQRLWQVVGHMDMFVLSAATAFALFFPPLKDDGVPREKIPTPNQVTFAIVILSHVAAYSVIGGAVLARYMLPAVPKFVLLCVSTLRRRVFGWPVAIGAICAAFVAGWFLPPPYHFAPEDNLAYSDFVAMHAAADKYVERHYPGATVLTAWPTSDELTKPYLGYVDKPVRVVRIEDFSLSQMVAVRNSTAPYDVVLAFSTKYEPPHPLLRWDRLFEDWQRRYFGYHVDLPPEVIAQSLGGKVVYRTGGRGLWVAVIDMQRTQNVKNVSPQMNADER